MAEQEPAPGSGQGAARRSADRLALALEEVGFDVGRAFPMLGSGLDRAGRPVVEVGRVAAPVAIRLAMVLSRAAELGVTTPAEDGHPDAAGPHGRHDPGEGN